MINETVFVPRLLLCGNASEFFARVGQRPYEPVGQIRFVGTADGQAFDFLNDGKFLIGKRLFDGAALPKMLRGGSADFLVFNDDKDLERVFEKLNQVGCPRSQVMTLREFNHLPPDGFYDMNSDMQLLAVLKNSSVKILLDADAHFAKSHLLTNNVDDSLAIDCICREEFLPLKENFFRRVYKDFSDCALKHYDAALIAERTPDDFAKVVSRLQSTADIVITFARNGSALERHLRDTASNFKRVNVLPSFAGNWIFCRVKKPQEDFAMYVVTHKALPPEHVQRLPAGYRVIHAGRALGQDLGYAGDDTGDNISDLNLYLNELTAFYWMWKNSAHEIIGLSHYRRFFTTDMKSFLNESDARNFLKDHDIITDRMAIHRSPTHEIMCDICKDTALVSFAESVVRKNLMRNHPDYLDAFDYKMNSPICYWKNMFVTRKSVFNAYCDWLFSFMLDSTREVLNRTRLAQMDSQARRFMGHFAERMLTVWLLKNRLRIKELPIVQLAGL